MRGQKPLENQVLESLSDPQNQDHPLHETLSQLWEAHHNLLNPQHKMLPTQPPARS